MNFDMLAGVIDRLADATRVAVVGMYTLPHAHACRVLQRRIYIAVLDTDPAPLSARPAPLVGPFNRPCTVLPFEAIHKPRDIDEQCDLAGNAVDSDDQEQNNGKNNFCAAGPLVWTTFFTFKQLQTAAVAAGGSGMPANRALLPTSTPRAKATALARVR